MEKLECLSMSYEWGKVGTSSYISNLIKNVNVEKPYAELWMGTHINAPSKLKSGKPLSDVINLPFLFKVLSINKALSIQAHPDKSLAEKLFSERPDVYKDDNHKPEMAVC